jgi:hypothetical protein
VVIIAGLEEGLFPHSRSADDEAELEEERRLCYVGITRAQRRLVLTSAARAARLRRLPATEPSRFIDEIPPNLMETVPSAMSFGGSAAYAPRAGIDGRVWTAQAGRNARLPLRRRRSVRAQRAQGRPARTAPHVRVGTVTALEPLDDDVKSSSVFCRWAEDPAGEVRQARTGVAAGLQTGRSIRRGPFHAVDNEHVHRAG